MKYTVRIVRTVGAIIIGLIAFHLTGCSWPSSVAAPAEPKAITSEGSLPDSELVTRVSWKVVDYGGPPYFHLYVTLNDETDYYAGYFWGENFETGIWADTPDNALTSAGAIWTGVGELFYIYQKNETELALMNHAVPYAAQPDEWEEYQEIMTIPVEQGSKIETGELLYVQEPYMWSQDYSLILYDSFVLGGLDNSGNLAPLSEEKLEDYWKVSGELGFRLFQDGEYLDTISYEYDDEWLAGAVGFGDFERKEPLTVELKYKGAHFNGLAINDGEPIVFAPKKIQTNADPESYVNDIAAILADNGLEDEPVHIREIVKTDIEGDGIEEVLIVASNNHLSDQFIDKPKEWYSIIVLQKVIEGRKESMLVTKQIGHQLSNSYEEQLSYHCELREIVDLDHDGICELLIAETSEAGPRYSVYKLVDHKLQLMLENKFPGSRSLSSREFYHVKPDSEWFSGLAACIERFPIFC